MTGGSAMWTFVVIVDNSFVLECLRGKPKINIVNQEFQMEERESTQHCHIYTAILSAKYTNLIVISLHENMSVDLGVLNR